MKYNLPFYETAKSEYLSDTETVRKTFRLAILAEQVIKFHTAVIVQNFLQSKDVRAEGKAYLGRGLSRPSLGLWAFFTEMIFPMIESEDLFWRDFPEYFQTTLKPITGELIPFRNTLHHGPTPSTQTCSTYQENIFPLIEKLETSGILGRERLVIGELISGSTTRNIDLISDDGRVLNLTPLLYYKEIIEEEVGESSKYFFYNDMRKSKEKAVGLLNYEIGLRETSDIYEEFRKTYPLEDWNTLQFARFQTRIDELTENFQGRTKELGDIQNFLKKGVGSFFVFGGPGMGKSSLLARAITLTLSSMEEKTDYSEEKYEIGENMGVCDYFIRRNTNTSYATTFFQMVGDDLEGIFQTGIQIGNNLDEMKQKWGERLLKIESKLKENKKENEKILKNKKEEKLKPTLLVIFIDGLDEGEEEIIKSIPAKAYEKILFLCSARDHVRQNLSHIESRMEISLGGLHPQEIAGLLRTLTLATKIDELYLKAVVEKSGGSPLYLKMLSDAILRGEIKPGELSNLPKEANDFYEEILGRMKAHPLGENILKTLFLLTISKDFITGDTIAFFLGTDRHTVEDYLATAKEVLWENPQTEDRLDYQLFHESLRDYILRNFPIELQNVRQSFLLQGIRNWEEINLLGLDPYTDEYLLKYSITHLLEDKATQKEAEDLVLNPDFLEAQLTTLNFYTVPMNDSKSVLQALILELGGKVGESKPIEEILLPKANPEELFRTTRLVQLVNHTGEVGFRAGNDIGIAWKWVEEGKVSEALERLRPIQDKQRLFDCYILVLWLLTLQEDGENNRFHLKQVLEEVEKNIPPANSLTVKWHDRFTITFFQKVCVNIISREIEITEIFERGDEDQKRDVILELLGFLSINGNYIFDDKIFQENTEFIKRYILKIFQISIKFKNPTSQKSIYTKIGELLIKFDDENINNDIIQILIEQSRKIENNYESCIALASLAKSIFLLGRQDLSKLLLFESLELSHTIDNYTQRINTYITIGQNLSKLGFEEDAKKIFLESLEISYKYENLLDQTRELLNHAELFSEKKETQILNKIVLQVIDNISKLSNSSSLSKVCQYLGEFLIRINDNEIIKQVYSNLLNFSIKIKYSDERSRLISILCSLLFKIDDLDLRINLTNILKDLIYKLDDPYDRSTTFLILGKILWNNSEKNIGKFLILESINVTLEIESLNFQSLSYISIFDTLFYIEEKELGKKILNDSLDVIRKIKNSNRKSNSIILISENLYKLGDIDLCVNIFPSLIEISYEIEDSSDLSKFLLIIGEIILKLNNFDLERSNFQAILKIVRSLKSDFVRRVTLFRFGEFLNKLGEIENGKILFFESHNIVPELNFSYSQIYSFLSLSEIMLKAGDRSLVYNLFNESLDLLGTIEDNNLLSKSIIKFNQTLSLLNDNKYIYNLLFKLCEHINKILDTPLFNIVILEINKSIILLNDIELSKNIIELFIKISNDRKDLFEKSKLLIIIAENYSLLGLKELGLNYYKESENVILKIEYLYNKSLALDLLGRSYKKIGEDELFRKYILDSIEVGNKIGNSYGRCLAITNVAETLFKIGDYTLGKNLILKQLEDIQGVQTPKYYSIAISYIADSLILINDSDFIKKILNKLLSLGRNLESYEYSIITISNLGKIHAIKDDIIQSKNLFHESLNIFPKIDSLENQSVALNKIVLSIKDAGSKKLFEEFIQIIFKLLNQINTTAYILNVIQSIAITTATFGSTYAYNFFETNHKSQKESDPSVMKAYTEEYRKIQWNESKSQDLFSYYMRSFEWVPYDGEFAKAGAYDLISTLAKLGKIDEALEAARGIGMIE